MVLVDEHMRSLKYDNVFAIGIAVNLPKVTEPDVSDRRAACISR